MPLRVSALRALGAYHNVFAIESFMDELARPRKPIRSISGCATSRIRARATSISARAERFGWAQSRRGSAGAGAASVSRATRTSRRTAPWRSKSGVDRESGRVRPLRAVAAIDSGEAVNPDGIRNQTEGGIIQSISWTLYEAVAFDTTRITSRDWSTYPILRFSNVPERVDVHIIDRPGEPFLGTGEAAQGPAAAALANAVADAIGVRIRDLPLDFGSAEKVAAIYRT